MAKDMEENLEANSLAIHQRFNNIIEAANKLPGNLGTELTKRLKEILKEVVASLSERDQLFFKEIANHKEAVVSLQ